VLQLPTAEATFVAVQPADDGVHAVSFGGGGAVTGRLAQLTTDAWCDLQRGNLEHVRDFFREDSEGSWLAYVLGPIVALAGEQNLALPPGLRILVSSRVPEGKGVSSSAAVEVASLRAFCDLLNVQLPGEEVARVCQLAENIAAGAPCGIMDQMTSALGRENELLALRCQPAVVEGFVAIPPEIKFWGIDSGIRHAVSGADYGTVRCGAFMGYRIIADLAGLEHRVSDQRRGTVDVADPQWHGYLANIAPHAFRERFEQQVPARMHGREFLDRYDGTSDRVTHVEPDREYAVRQPTLHPIEENARVERFRTLLQGAVSEQSLREMGALMYASHASYSACGLGSHGTDLLVQMVRDAGSDSGLYGAKITGGGSGGTVAILARADAEAAVQHVASEYAQQTGRGGYIFRGSSPGACATDVIRVTIDASKSN
jgi:L-arabinokinase